MTVANLLVFRGLRPASPPLDAPLVSILIPARNETHNIEKCVTSLLFQDYPNWELIVLDDRSEDDTRARAVALARSQGRGKVVVLDGSPLPAGWIGKNWACHQLSQQARGDFLFFTDADTMHEPGTVTAAVHFAMRQDAGLVTAWPQFITKTLGEKLIIPVIVLVGFLFCAHWLIALLQRHPSLARKLGGGFTSTLGAANGQFMFFTRRCYDAIGGHEAVRSNIVEDIALGRRVAGRMGEGMKLCICDAFQFSKVRMYRSFRETWAGFSKNLRAMFGTQSVLFWIFILGLWFCLLGPTVRWLWVSNERRPSILVSAGVVMAIRFTVTLRCRTSWVGALLHPFGVALVIAIALRSWWLSRTQGVVWKGRRYT